MELPGGYDVAVILLHNESQWVAPSRKDWMSGSFLGGVAFAIVALKLPNYTLLNGMGEVFSTNTLFNLTTEDGGLLVEFDERELETSELTIYQNVQTCAEGKLLCMGDLCVLFQDERFVEGAKFMCNLAGRQNCEVQVK